MEGPLTNTRDATIVLAVMHDRVSTKNQIVTRASKDEMGRPDGCLQKQRDITERKQVDEALRNTTSELENTLEHIGTPFISLDQQWRYTYLNHSALEYIHEEPKNVLGMVFWDKSPHLLGSPLESAFRKVLAEQVVIDTEYYWQPLNQWFHSRAFPTPSGISVIACNITEQKAVESALDHLARMNEELEKRVAERTASLEQGLQSLQGVLYHVAHDLRAPLRSMHAFTQLLQESRASNLDATETAYANIIVEASKRMDVLIRDLLNYGHLGHQNVQLVSVDLKTLVNDLLAEMKDRAESKKALITVDEPLPAVWADPRILKQVLANLIGNSLKFIPPGAAPCIRMWAEAGAGTVRLHIEDKGIGIAPDYQERIFWVFERLHTDGDYQGTGIGLAIVKKGMERLGGRVGVESKLGEGSRFWLELPASSPSL
ncbi:MAG: sensor signal transduction histidine kinase [Pedosphaera sp.]|nr:sensor signal transduction histidine kinase [Pedosphaera sp.]